MLQEIHQLVSSSTENIIQNSKSKVGTPFPEGCELLFYFKEWIFIFLFILKPVSENRNMTWILGNSKLSQPQPPAVDQGATQWVRLPGAPSNLSLSASRDAEPIAPLVKITGFCKLSDKMKYII